MARAKRVAVHLGHLQVGDHEVVAFAAPLGERLGAAARGVGFQAQDLQLALQHGEVDRMVVDDQQLGAGRRIDRRPERRLPLRAGSSSRIALAAACSAASVTETRVPRPSVLVTWIAAAHQLDQLARDGEPEAGAAVAPAGVGFALLERLEQAPLGLGAHADAGIVHAEAERLAPLSAASPAPSPPG